MRGTRSKPALGDLRRVAANLLAARLVEQHLARLRNDLGPVPGAMVAASADALGNAAAQAVISGSRRVDMTVSERLTEVAILCRDRITVVARDVPNEHRHTDGALRVYSALSAAAQALVDHVDSAGDPLFLAFAFAALGRAEEAAEVLGRHARSAAKGGPKGVHTPQIRLILEANPAASTAALRRAVPGADPSTIRRVKREFKRA